MESLVPPIIPDAQKNRSPDIFLEGMRGGLAAMAQFASIRRQSEADIARLALQERLASQEHDLAAQRMSQDYELKDRQITNEEELLPYRKMQMEAMSEYTKNTKGALARQSAARISTLNDFNRQVAKYGLDDPNPKNPVEFYANARRLKDEFSWANIPDIKHALKQIDMTTEQHTVPISVNESVKDEATGETVIRPLTKNIPIGRIVEGLKDPAKQDNMMRVIERSGLLEETSPGNKRIKGELRKLIEAGKNVDFSRSRSRVAPGGPLSEPATELPAPDLPAETPSQDDTADDPDLFGVTNTEKYLEQAQAALKRGAPLKEVAKRLQGFGIDPSTLWAT